MTLSHPARLTTVLIAFFATVVAAGTARAATDGWSIAPFVGTSLLGDQSATIAGADDIADGDLDVTVDTGFVAGLGVRYDYADSRWTSEFGWEYRSNDATTTTADGSRLPGGNYASNTFFINGRYALREGARWTPWIGGGLTWLQELDLDSEDADGERSFADSGAVGFQVMAGVNLDWTDRFYLSGELRYSGRSELDLDEEGGSGRVSDIDYPPITLGLGVGVRF